MKFLKKIRTLLALLVFCLISAQFLDLYHLLPQSYYELNPTKTQFTPSLILLKTFSFGVCAAGIAFAAFSIFAIIFGRVYCSFVCPFGILMDIIHRMSYSKKRRLKYAYSKGKNILRALFLTLAAFSIVLGYTALLGLIEPYSLYGKIMGSFASCIGTAINQISSALYAEGIYFLQPTSGKTQISLAAFSLSIFILAAISIASYARGRIFCNTICPVGAFLGLLSRFSLFKISIDKNSCVSCGICEKLCKAQCINSKEKRLDFSRCVLCFNCAAKCPKSSVKILPTYPFKKTPQSEVGKNLPTPKDEASSQKYECEFSRRSFYKNGALSLAALALTRNAFAEKGREGRCASSSNISPFKNPRSQRKDSRLAVPAGAGSVENFLSKCTGCQACVSACETFILKPSISEWGWGGIMQPFMDFRNGYCLHACNSCTEVCPVGAIAYKSVEEKKKIKIGTAILMKSLCVVETDGTDCAACAEHCPVQAIEMRPYKPEKSLYIPHVHSRVCIGCGACEYICPVKPKKAIVIKGLAEHEEALDFKDVPRRRRKRGFKDENFSPEKTPDKKEATPSDNPFPF